MTPQQFVAKWQRVDLSERSACQQHFLDLCELLGQPKPAEADPDGAWYTFERGVRKTEGGSGWADVWMKGHFGWEYKKKKRDLSAAYKQLLLYREDLENPPLLIVCDLDRFEVHTNFTGTLKTVHAFDLSDLTEPKNLAVLRAVFTDPNALKPGVTAQGVTEQAAELIGQLADGMRIRKIPAQQAAHFLMKLMFCMFAEDIDLLPGKVFERIMDAVTKASSRGMPDSNAGQRFAQLLTQLFEAMAHGGLFGTDEIMYFDGGLFADADVIELTPAEMLKLRDIARLDWSGLEPSIFGTLFERTLDPAKRSQIGAHFTSRDDIVTLVEPVVMAPLRREWAEVKAEIATLWKNRKAQKEKTPKLGPKRRRTVVMPQASTGVRRKLEKLFDKFSQRLAHVSILDPACGSGNFLYVALNLLLDLEKEVIAYAARHHISLLPQVRPTQLAGIEINPFAQELASVVIWIGYLQWMKFNGFNPPNNPVLEPIKSIRLMDAILDLSDPENPKEPEWPEAEFIVGNPPFLGSSAMRKSGVSEAYVDTLRSLYGLPGKSDLCCYWFEKTRRNLKAKKVKRAGLLATQAIRHGGARAVLDAIKRDTTIFFAESNRPWKQDGAAVNISMIGFGETCHAPILDGRNVGSINTDLTSDTDLTIAQLLRSNTGRSFEGIQKGGPFEAEYEHFCQLLHTPTPHGRPCSDVVRPRANGERLFKNRAQFDWMIDFGVNISESDAANYAPVFEWLRDTIAAQRLSNPTAVNRNKWWIHKCSRPELREAVLSLRRFLATGRVSAHRVFVFLDAVVIPDSRLFAFADETDELFGFLSSRMHQLWALRQGARHGDGGDGGRPTYNNKQCFETFPFPEPTDAERDAISEAAKELDRLRSNWLNPPEWTKTEVLEFPGSADGPWKRYVDPATVDERGIGTVRYPRLVPKDTETAKELKKRTLTNLYNQRPTWLDLAHRRLDEAVFDAYGWPVDLSDDDLLARLLELNLARAAEQ